MKTAIATITKDINIGNRLQNYALQKFLEKMGIECETLFVKDSQMLPQISLKKMVKMVINHNNYRNLDKREKVFSEFNKKYINISEYRIDDRNGNLEWLDDKYDYFIAGSDQVWNPNAGFATNFEFLKFCDEEKRISYAASIGMDELDNVSEKIIKDGIQGFKGVSVRESSAVGQIKDLTDREVVNSIDPTLLLNVAEWNEIERKPQFIGNEKYIVKYIFGEEDEKVSQSIKKEIEEKGLKVIDLLDIKNRDFYTVAPDEFLWLIHHAEFIITNSFHSIVFSIIYRKQFWTIRRKDSLKSMNSRITSLLELFDISTRDLSEIDFETLISYGEIEKTIESERTKSKQYLENMLK